MGFSGASSLPDSGSEDDGRDRGGLCVVEGSDRWSQQGGERRSPSSLSRTAGFVRLFPGDVPPRGGRGEGEVWWCVKSERAMKPL